jgi:hypothetical protein
MLNDTNLKKKFLLFINKDKHIFYICVVVENKKLKNMQAVCPITDKKINERVARINAFITVLLVVSFIVFNFWPALVLLAIDFVTRGFFDSRCSVICITSKWIVSTFNLKGKVMNAGPKIFAAQVGLVFSIVAITLFFAGFQIAGIAVASILGLFSFLETAFGFCVACKLYPLFRKLD